MASLRDVPGDEAERTCGDLDLDGDGELGFGDYLIVSAAFGEEGPNGATLDFAFFLEFSDRFGEACGTATCEVGPAPPDPAPENCEETCIPLELYGQAAAREYYNECRNYCHADDHCFDRAQSLVGKVDELCDTDVAGPDGVWCNEFADPASTGGCDDLAYKVVIRYPCGSKWRYHIASVAKTCELGQCVIDPLGSPDDSPTTSCVTPQQWCEQHAHGLDVQWRDTASAPPADTVYCELVPGDQVSYRDTGSADPRDNGVIDLVCDRLEAHTEKLCRGGLTPFPSCTTDSDGDGIPDDYDKCPNTAPGVPVDYCDPDTLGCASDGPGCPPEDADHYSLTVDWERVADADYDARAVTGSLYYDDRHRWVNLDATDLETQCRQPDSGSAIGWSMRGDIDDDEELTLEVWGTSDTWVGGDGTPASRGLVCAGWISAPEGCSVVAGEEPSDDDPDGGPNVCTCVLTKGELDAWIADGNQLAVEVLSTDLNFDEDFGPLDRDPDPPLACTNGG